MSQITATITAYYLFEIAESIRLGELSALLGGAASRATLYDKAPGAPRVQYIQPPVVVDGAAFNEATLADFRVRVKFFDYGVVSLALARPFAGGWQDLVAVG